MKGVGSGKASVHAKALPCPARPTHLQEHANTHEAGYMNFEAEPLLMDGSDGYCCFICLEDTPPLIRPCACRCLCCHQTCLARWQLQSAGREEESKCRFCKQVLPDWKAAFADCSGQVVPVMSIQYNGKVYWLEATPGGGGVDQFKDNVRHLLGLSPQQSFDITFECRVPGADHSRMELHGLHAYDAAVYCASLTAARRLSRNGDVRNSIDKPTNCAWPNNSSGSDDATAPASRSRASSSSGSSTTPTSSSNETAAPQQSSRASSSGSSAGTPTHWSSSSSSGSRRSSIHEQLDSSSTADAPSRSGDEYTFATDNRVDDRGGSIVSLSQATVLLQSAAAHVLGYFRLMWQPPEDLDEFC